LFTISECVLKKILISKEKERLSRKLHILYYNKDESVLVYQPLASSSNFETNLHLCTVFKYADFLLQ